MEYEQLSDGNKQLVAEFKSISDTGDSDHDKIIRLLDIHDWNLNNAILSYFDNGFVQESQSFASSGDGLSSGVDTASDPVGDVSGSIEESENESHLHSRRYSTLANSFELSDLIPKLPFAPRISNNWQLDIGINASLHHQNISPLHNRQYQSTTLKAVNSIWFILLFVPQKLVTVLYHIFRYLFQVNRENYFPSSVDYDSIDLDYKLPLPTKESDPDEKSDTKPTTVESEYNLYHHDYNKVYEKSRTNYEWLLVILVDDSPESTDFYQHLLTNKSFAQLFSKNSGQFSTTNIYINNAIKNPECFEVGKAYKAKRLPYIMLINNVTNNPNVMASMSMTYKSNISTNFLRASHLPVTINKIISNLKKTINHYNPQIISALADKREIEMSRQLKEFQDSAYEKSLQADKQKKIKKQEELRKQQLIDTRKQYLLQLISSNWFENLNVAEDEGTKPLRIQIKLPHGQNLKLSIVNHDITIYELYLYVELKLYIQELIEDEENEFESESDIINQEHQFSIDSDFIENYRKDFPFKFELLQPYPKRIYEHLDHLLTEDLKSGDSLLVEYTNDSDVDEE